MVQTQAGSNQTAAHSTRTAFFDALKVVLTVQVPRHSTAQFPSTFAGDVDQILEIVSGGQAEATDEVLGDRLDVAIVAALETCQVVLGTAKVCVG